MAISSLRYVSLLLLICSNGIVSFYPRERKSFHSLSLKEESRMNIYDMEKEVVATAQLQLDKKRVVQALEETQASSSLQKGPEKTALLASRWQISAAASITAFVGTFAVTQSSFLAFVALTGVFITANRDPVDDESLEGAVSRNIGRAAIKTVESSKPRLQRIAIAAITDGDQDESQYFKSEIGRQQISSQNPRLGKYILQLEEEAAALSLWKQNRQMVDQYLPYYSLEDLQKKALQNNIDFNCTKVELMMRLLENNIIQLY
jgi:hypothetical protein